MKTFQLKKKLSLLLVTVIFGSYGTGYDAQSFIYGQF